MVRRFFQKRLTHPGRCQILIDGEDGKLGIGLLPRGEDNALRAMQQGSNGRFSGHPAEKLIDIRMRPGLACGMLIHKPDEGGVFLTLVHRDLLIGGGKQLTGSFLRLRIQPGCVPQLLQQGGGPGFQRIPERFLKEFTAAIRNTRQMLLVKPDEGGVQPLPAQGSRHGHLQIPGGQLSGKLDGMQLLLQRAAILLQLLPPVCPLSGCFSGHQGAAQHIAFQRLRILFQKGNKGLPDFRGLDAALEKHSHHGTGRGDQIGPGALRLGGNMLILHLEKEDRTLG